MEPLSRPAFSFPGLWFGAGSTQIHLILEHRESGPAGASRGEGLAISRTQHVAFEVEEAKPAIERLQELGVPIVSGPKFRPDGPTQFYVLDPDGNLIELFAVR
jgi:catechol 2,3-dioxygenase-like lactoylglutathione lyase family enzyme